MRIDHDQRRSEIVDAVWRIIIREGVRGASVRGVAREAQLSMGSVRYFFATQDELLHFAMQEVVLRASHRIQNDASSRVYGAQSGDPVSAVVALLEQVLPLDTERLTEARVWLAFTVHGITDSVVRNIRQQADHGVRDLCRTCLSDLDQFGLIAADRNLDLEADRLWALLDGLTLHILWMPTLPAPTSVIAIVDRHLRDLANSTSHLAMHTLSGNKAREPISSKDF